MIKKMIKEMISLKEIRTKVEKNCEVIAERYNKKKGFISISAILKYGENDFSYIVYEPDWSLALCDRITDEDGIRQNESYRCEARVSHVPLETLMKYVLDALIAD